MNFGEIYHLKILWFDIFDQNRDFLKTNIFIVNLAISDLCMLSTQGLPCVIYAFDSDHWIYGPLALLSLFWRVELKLFFCSLVSKYVICMYPYQVNNVAYRHNEVIIKFSPKLLLQHVQDTFIICRFSQHDKLMPRFISKEGLLQRYTEKKEPWNIMIVMAKLGKNCMESRWKIGFL